MPAAAQSVAAATPIGDRGGAARRAPLPRVPPFPPRRRDARPAALAARVAVPLYADRLIE